MRRCVTTARRDVRTRVQVACVNGVRFQSVAAGAAHTVAVAVGGAVYTCGRGITTGSGETADRLKMAPVQALDGVPAVACGAGAGHTGVVSEEGDVYMWGWGGHGQLGHGALSMRLSTPVKSSRGMLYDSLGCVDCPANFRIQKLIAWNLDDPRWMASTQCV
jgi:alpha-tubulin suppressor-like RCC1 family protein